MSSGGGSQTSTQKTEIPAYIQDAQKNTLATAQRFTDPFLQNPPATTVAGFTPDQTAGFDLARQMAQNMFGTPGATAPQTNVAQNYIFNGQNGPHTGYTPIPAQESHPLYETTWEQAATPQAVAAQQYNAASSGVPANMSPASAGYATTSGTATTDPRSGQVGGDAIHALLNPYTKDVLDPTIDRMRRELGQTQAAIGARNASAASFGGSRGALQSAEANRAFGDQVALTTGQLMAQGYDRATATALANANNAQQVGEFNAGQTNQMGQFNTGQINQRGEFNANLQDEAERLNKAAYNAALEANAQRQQSANAGNAAAVNNMGQFNASQLADIAKFNTQERQGAQQFNAGQGNSALQYFAGLANQANQFNATQEQAAIGRAMGLSENDANRALTASGLQNTFANDEARRQATALQQLLGTGATQQANDQSNLSQPIDMLRLLQQSTPGNIGTTSTTTQPKESNPIGALAGLASIASLFMPSDRRDKTDIKKLGEDPQSGLPMYAYRYKSDPKSNPKVMGPMAQDVEKKYPGTVHEIGGHKVIDMHALLSAVSQFQDSK